MARGGAYLRNISKLNIAFGIGSLLLFLGIIGMIADDHIREWKGYQREFNRLDVEKTRDQIKNETANLDQEKLTILTQQIKEAQKEIEARKEEIKKNEAEIKGIATKLYKANQDYQFTKSRHDAIKYNFQVALNEGRTKEASKYEKELQHEDALLLKGKKQVDSLTLEKENKEKTHQSYSVKSNELQEKIDALLKGKKRFERKLSKITPGFKSWFLNLPMLDFIAPTRKIQQVVLEDLVEDYHFATVERVDRCMTCHMGIDKEGWENDAQPFKSHPRLDLFVASDSPHPVEKFGCTVCHAGSGQAVTFFETAHTPRSEEQKQEWAKKYEWKPHKYVEEKMLPMNMIESSCYLCHKQEGAVNIVEAPKLSEGIKLFVDRGCYGCHLVKGFENLRKPGPDLSHLSSKTNPTWTFKWIKKPDSFLPNAKMPQFFDLFNTLTPEDIEMSNVEIEGIVEYLFKHSKEFDLPEESAPGGDPEKGKELVFNVGCFGCHAFEDWKGATFGPDLNGAGSKVNSAWLKDWLINPKHYWEENRMPSLRLTDQEANDMTAYLMTLKNEEFDSLPKPDISQSALDEMTLEYLTSQYGTIIGNEKFEAMSSEDKKVYVGERAIGHYGCAGCHTIPGFEKAGLIGTEQTEVGSKNLHTIDFGLNHFEHTRHSWLYHKIGTPRIFDKGKVKTRLEKLKMPNYNFTDEETKAMALFFLSLKKDNIHKDIKRQLTDREKVIEEGRALVHKYNCQGCHNIENEGGEIAQTLGEGMSAPPLYKEGEKVWGDWLHSFLKEPSTIRPWLQVRMPSYDFSEKEVTALVKYFKALDKQKFTYKAKEEQIPHPTKEEWEAGKMIVEKFSCFQCHEAEPSPGKSAADLAPDLKLSRERLKPRWVLKWMVDPQKLYPGTRMPGYFPDMQSPLPDVLGGSAKKQILAIRAYMLNLDLYEETKKVKPKTNNSPKNNSRRK